MKYYEDLIYAQIQLYFKELRWNIIYLILLNINKMSISESLNRKSKNFYYTTDITKLSHHPYNAGILPYQIGEDGNIYFLLGRDQQGYWADFGGKCDSHKDRTKDGNNIKYTAARECYEETCGSLLGIDELKSMLSNKNNYIVINSESMSGISYYMFILKVPYRPNIITDRFNHTYNMLKYINASYQYTEKNEIKWFSIETLWEMLEGKNPLYKLKDVFRQTLIKNKQELYILQRLNKKKDY